MHDRIYKERTSKSIHDDARFLISIKQYKRARILLEQCLKMREEDYQNGGGFATDLSIIHHDLAKTLEAIANELQNPSIQELIEYRQLCVQSFYEAYLLRNMIFGSRHVSTVETGKDFNLAKRKLSPLVASCSHFS